MHAGNKESLNEQIKLEVITEASVNHSHSHLDNNTTNSSLYMAVLYYAGQQASGIQALIGLQCLASSLNLPVVILEPVITYNRFKAMPAFKLNSSGYPMVDKPSPFSVMPFSDLFDLELFNEMSSAIGYPPLAPRDYFFKTAPKNIIFVAIYQGRGSQAELTQLWPLGDAHIGGCFNPLTSELSADFKSQLYQIILNGFCVIKVIVFRTSHVTSLVFTEDQLRQSILGDHSFNSFTLVFSVWMPKFVITGSKGRECVFSGYRSSKEQLQPSKKVLKDAKFYEEHFLKSTGKHLTLMIRLEHIHSFLRRASNQWSVEKCLNDAASKVNELQTSMSLGNPFVTLDIGKFGSKTLRSIGWSNIKKGTERINDLLSSLYDGGWDLKKWEDSFTQATGGVGDSSYIAALQRTLASKSECLILVGGGMFQELAMKKYMESRDKADWCIHIYCMKERGGYVMT